MSCLSKGGGTMRCPACLDGGDGEMSCLSGGGGGP